MRVHDFISLKQIRLAAVGSIALLVWAAVLAVSASTAYAQVSYVEDAGASIERIDVFLTNPSPDPAVNARVTDLIRRNLRLFPSDRFSRVAAEIGLARARRGGPIEQTRLSVAPGGGGALIVTVEATLRAERAEALERGVLLTGQASDLPLLLDRGGTVLTTKLEALPMVYANSNAWYGRPDLFLAGNPLVSGKAAGSGATAWAEGFVHAGVYGITPVAGNTFIYAGLSGILSGSAGRELFTDDTRSHVGTEDAYVGLVGGQTSEAGDRFVWNVSAGRKRFGIGDGFLIANTASNGSTRGALQSNPRWAADTLVVGQVRFGTAMAEAFYLDPDELPVVDSKTRITGLNLELGPRAGLDLGATYLKVLDSAFGYFATTASSPAGVAMGREGLEVFDLRLQWRPGHSGVFIATEAAVQRNARFDMRATGEMAELGYRFAEASWLSELSYRIARFSGDDPGTARFERWDPLLSGGNGEQWVQGINHFKIFQNSNLIAHRLQARLRPSARFELVPQFWLFRADRTTNLGGNPALSVLNGTQLGQEANITGKWFVAKNVFVQGHLAVTFPGSGVRNAPGVNAVVDPWLSAMVFVRVAF
jgi:hypothetical protein